VACAARRTWPNICRTGDVPRRCRPELGSSPGKHLARTYQCAVAAVNARARSGGGMADGKRHAVRADFRVGFTRHDRQPSGT
jgi:hypothetical protein